MKNVDELAEIVLENEAVPVAEVVTVVPHVRTDMVFPKPAWASSGDDDVDTDSPVD